MKDAMKRTKNILVLSAPVGSGHKMAAQALVEAFSALPDMHVAQGDVFTLFPAFLGQIFLTCYKMILRFCPLLYSLSYRWGNTSSGSLFLRAIINRIILRFGKKYLDAAAPDMVLSTHGTPTGILSLYKKKYAPQLRLGVIVTDYTVHRWLVYPEVDVYFIAERDLRKQVLGMLPAQGEFQPAIKAFGIPVRKMLVPLCDKRVRQTVRRALCRDFGWPENVFICLIAGGGDGMLPMEEIVSFLLRETDETLRILTVTGHNIALQKRLESNNVSKDDRVKISGFTEELPKLIAAADLMIGKGGGISIAECLSLGTPLLIYSPLPGQEQKNTEFLLEHKGAKVVYDGKEIAAVVWEEIHKTDAKREEERENLRCRLGHSEAAIEIAKFTKSFTI